MVLLVLHSLCRARRGFVEDCLQHLLISILAFCSVSASAQNLGKDSLGVIIKWTPSSLYTPETPTMRFGVEVLLPQFSKRGLSIQFDYGFRYRISANPHPYDNASISSQLDPFHYVNKRYSKLPFRVAKVLRSN